MVEHLLTDSRRLLFPATTVFFALHTGNRNGADFIEELYQRGVRSFVMHNSDTLVNPLPGANILQSADVLAALQQLAARHRSQFSLPVIGITGSNGKTIVKEWLYQLLQQEYTILRSPRSYNSQTGVPLSVWPLAVQHNLAIFEAGISQPGEMERLASVIQPSIGILTNIGTAHDEGFADSAEKLAEKCKLFAGASVVVGSHPLLAEAPLAPNIRRFTWGSETDATLRISTIEKLATQTRLTAWCQEQALCITVPFTDDASVENALTCWCVLLHLGTPHHLTVQRMLLLQPVEMRLQVKKGIHQCTLINDSYSADLHSLIIALNFLEQQQQQTKHTVILSDIAGSGKTAQSLYTELAGILQQKNIHRLIGVGPLISQYADSFSSIAETDFFADTASLLQQFHSLQFSNETILVKGARMFTFEKIIRRLEQKAHQTVLEINLGAIAHNLKVYRQLLHPGTRMMVMVKASGYGSGSFEVANLLQFHKADYLAVAYTDEGVEIRQAGIRLPIMVMNAEAGSFDVLIQHHLEPEIYSPAMLLALEKYLQQSGITHYPVHIKLDTGMKRLGFEAADMPSLCAQLSATNTFKVQSVFSHLAASDTAEHDDFTRSQATLFLSCAAQLQEALGYPFLRHIANTSAIHRHPDLQLDMVRLGIGLYGADENEHIRPLLRNVTTLKTTIAQLKRVKAGQTVGYSRKGMVSEDSVIATVRIGYADGYPRLLSNGRGTMLVNGQAAPVIGNVCMDMTMLNVSHIPDVNEGDDVIVFGEQQPVGVVAGQAATIAYEILTGITQRVVRVYFEE